MTSGCQDRKHQIFKLYLSFDQRSDWLGDSAGKNAIYSIYYIYDIYIIYHIYYIYTIYTIYFINSSCSIYYTCSRYICKISKSIKVADVDPKFNIVSSYSFNK